MVTIGTRPISFKEMAKHGEKIDGGMSNAVFSLTLACLITVSLIAGSASAVWYLVLIPFVSLAGFLFLASLSSGAESVIRFSAYENLYQPFNLGINEIVKLIFRIDFKWAYDCGMAIRYKEDGMDYVMVSTEPIVENPSITILSKSVMLAEVVQGKLLITVTIDKPAVINMAKS